LDIPLSESFCYNDISLIGQENVMTLRSATKAVRVAAIAGVVLYVVAGIGLMGPRAQQQNQKTSNAALMAFSSLVQGLATRYFATHPILPPLTASPPPHKHSSAPH